MGAQPNRHVFSMHTGKDMTRRSVLFALALLVSGGGFAMAHDGHGETVVISGTIRAFTQGNIDIETRDDVSMQFKRVLVVANAKTQYKRGKARVTLETAQPEVGERVSVVARSEDGPGNSLQWVAVQVELRARKTS